MSLFYHAREYNSSRGCPTKNFVKWNLVHQSKTFEGYLLQSKTQILNKSLLQWLRAALVAAINLKFDGVINSKKRFPKFVAVISIFVVVWVSEMKRGRRLERQQYDFSPQFVNSFTTGHIALLGVELGHRKVMDWVLDLETKKALMQKKFIFRMKILFSFSHSW